MLLAEYAECPMVVNNLLQTSEQEIGILREKARGGGQQARWHRREVRLAVWVLQESGWSQGTETKEKVISDLSRGDQT